LAAGAAAAAAVGVGSGVGAAGAGVWANSTVADVRLHASAQAATLHFFVVIGRILSDEGRRRAAGRHVLISMSSSYFFQFACFM
jgi:hypothetical protein